MITSNLKKINDLKSVENLQSCSKIQMPSILAPAGNKASFLSAIAAGADSIYCGLKSFSARMEAKNFTIDELTSLTQLAHDKGIKVYVAFNSILKPNELNEAGELIKQLEKQVKPDGLIVQDLSFAQLIKQTNFSNEIHLSTLANVSFPKALKTIHKQFGVNGVVVPREFSIDQMKDMAAACPDGMSLEVFVHGALCYGVSGRCYWSSYFGGKSGLRGRCVQPCRRFYAQNNQTKRFFSCQDISLDVLAKTLLNIPKITTWKIEGRKKGPHYVFYTVKAYRLLRDYPTDSNAKKTAIELLDQSLGRNRTHYNFLPQHQHNPIDICRQTGSGLIVGKIQGAKQKSYFDTREELFQGDVLRVGYEDDPWHSIQKVGKYIPKRGRLYLKSFVNSKAKNSPVFLVNRLEKALETKLSELEKQIIKVPTPKIKHLAFNAKLSKKFAKKIKPFEIDIFRKISFSKYNQVGFWLNLEIKKRPPKQICSKIWWCIPPIIFPNEEEKLEEIINYALKNGGRNFILNAPWQIAFFKNPKQLNIWTGPFCNMANVFAVDAVKSLGFSGCIVSPELDQKSFFDLPKQSPLPLGIVISGNLPLCISRICPENLKLDALFTSPKGEGAWVTQHGNDFWIYPNWQLDLKDKQNELQQAGYTMFIHIIESTPHKLKLKKRQGLWNWKLHFA